VASCPLSPGAPGARPRRGHPSMPALDTRSDFQRQAQHLASAEHRAVIKWKAYYSVRVLPRMTVSSLSVRPFGGMYTAFSVVSFAGKKGSSIFRRNKYARVTLS